MAPTFRPGKSATILFNNVDMGSVSREVSVEASVAELDTTVFGNSDETVIAGVRGASISVSGLYDGTALSTASTASTGAFDHRWAAALGASTQPILTIGVDGTTIGRRARLVKAEVTGYTAQAPADGVVQFTAAAKVSGRHDFGVFLHSLKAETASSTGFTAVNSGITGGTTGGGVGHFHMTAASTVATFQAKVQHSSAGVSWADLITFSSSTGTTGAGAVQRSTVAGTVKQYTRGQLTTFTGGTGKTATFAIAFARRRYPI